MPKRFTFQSVTRKMSHMGDRPRKFAEPSREQIEKAKETWKRLAPKEAKGLIK